MNNVKLVCPVCGNEHDIRKGDVKCKCGAVFDMMKLKWNTQNIRVFPRRIPVLHCKYRL